MPLQPTPWNTLDGAVLNFIDHYDKAVRYRRLHYLLIPPSISPHEIETQDNKSPFVGSKLRLRVHWPSSRDEDEDAVQKVTTKASFSNFSPTAKNLSNHPSSALSSVAVQSAPLSKLSWTPGASKMSGGGPSESIIPSSQSKYSSFSKASEQDHENLRESVMEKHLADFQQICNHLRKMSVGDLDPMTVDIDDTCLSTFEVLTLDQKKQQVEEENSLIDSSRITSGHGVLLSKLAKPRTTKLRLKGRSRRYPEWIYLEYDKKFSTDRCYRITLQFLVCSGATIQDFCVGLKKLCKRGNTVMMQVPEYTHPHRSPYIHAFFVPLHLPLPLAKDATLAALVQDAIIFRYGFVLEADVEGSLNARSTSLSQPIDPSLAQGLKGRRVVPHFGGHHQSASSIDVDLALAESQRWAGRQYLHRSGTVFVRILRDGLLWIPNRMTETREKWGDAEGLFIEFREFCKCLQACYDIVREVIEKAMGAAVLNADTHDSDS